MEQLAYTHDVLHELTRVVLFLFEFFNGAYMPISRVFHTLTLLAALALSPCTAAKNIILDMNGVITKTDKATAFWLTGPKVLVWYFSHNPHMVPSSSHKIRYKLLYPLLNNVMAPRSDSIVIPDEEGIPMPQLMVDWMTGDLSSAQIRSLVSEALVLYPDLCAHNAERALMKSMTTMMFTPALLAKVQKIIPESKECIRMWKEQGHRLFIISNFDADTFALIREQDPEFFDLFDDIIVSAHVGMVKPGKEIFEHTLVTNNLVRHDSLFIDDTPTNLDTAYQCGIATVLCQNNDLTSLMPAVESWLQTRAHDAEMNHVHITH